MTERIRLDDLNDDQLDALHARLDTAETLLRDAESYLSALHHHAGRHDVLGEGYACAGCALLADITRHLTDQKET